MRLFKLLCSTGRLQEVKNKVECSTHLKEPVDYCTVAYVPNLCHSPNVPN